MLGASELAMINWLTWQVRLATADQVKEFCDGHASPARNLERTGYVKKTDLVVAIARLESPLYVWAAGQEGPRFDSLAWTLEKRRRRVQQRRTTIFRATERAVRLCGGCGGRLRQPLQIDHDLGTTAIYLRRRVLDPESACRWLSEDMCRLLFANNGKVPDAVLCTAEGPLERAIEYGGHYSATRLRGFHRACCRRRLPYELW